MVKLGETMSFLEKLKSLFKEEVPVVEAPKPVELKKRTKKLVEKKETVDLGVTTVRLKFEDGRELLTRIYGRCFNSNDEGKDELGPKLYYGQDGPMIKHEGLVEPTTIYFEDSSLVMAESFIRKLGNGQSTQVDDPRKPTVSFVGKVISAQIIKTEQCLEEVIKYSVEPI